MSSHDDLAAKDAPSSSASDVTAAVKSPPDWSQVKHEIFCPLCGYNLRGLAEPRCPECGYRFEWAEMLDPNAAKHPYLFEHHPERNVWSYYRTVLGACRPKRFWTTLHPRQWSRPGRLLLYWVSGVFSLLLICIVFPLSSAVVETNMSRAVEAAQVSSLQARYGKGSYPMSQSIWVSSGQVPNGYLFNPLDEGIQGWLRAWSKRLLRFRQPAWAVLGWMLIWPWLTWLSLMVFQASMRRARVRLIHVLRCTVYSFELSSWVSLATMMYLLVSLSSFLFLLSDSEKSLNGWRIRSTMAFDLSLAIVSVGILYSSIRLIAAYRWYLRFDRPVATVLASQAIALLLAPLITIGIIDWRILVWVITP